MAKTATNLSGQTYKRDSQRTQVKAFRISNAHFALLNSPHFKNKSSSIIRVLLTLYFNKKIPLANIEELIEADARGASKAIEDSLFKYRESLSPTEEG